MPTPIPMPVLNWRELAALVDQLKRDLDVTGAAPSRWFIERAVVPERPRFPGGFLKSEWCLRLSSRKEERVLIFSVRPRAPYILLKDEKSPRAAPGATQSTFGLALAKHLKGAKLQEIEVPPRERPGIFWFSADSAEHGKDTRRLGLALTLIPALPEALLIRDTGLDAFPILARSRTIREGAVPTEWSKPDGSQAPAERPLREDVVGDFVRVVERALDSEALDLRLRAAQRSARDTIKQARDRLRQSETAILESQKEPDWRLYGDLLKARLSSPPELVVVPATKPGQPPTGYRELPQFDDALPPVRVPCDAKLSPSAQVEKFYSMAKRKQRRRDEANYRLETARAAESRFAQALAELERGDLDWKSLENRERQLGLSAPGISAEGPKHPPSKNRWLGKSFVSRDGFNIWVGRSRDENLELTFKHARGNDIWMHVRGRPGAHTLIPIPGGKSAPLETLLDAASLTIYYSGGEKWGKTEVDYTFKKYVKRIKDSTEASYTQNKTLIVEPDAVRLKRLLDGAS